MTTTTRRTCSQCGSTTEVQSYFQLADVCKQCLLDPEIRRSLYKKYFSFEGKEP